MLTPNYFEKSPWESFTVYGDFSNVMASDETIVLASSSILIEDKNGDDVTDTVLVTSSEVVSGFTLRGRVQAGSESLSPYKITYKAITSASEQYSVEQFMNVKE